MALRDLVEGECGGANSLVRLTSHIIQDRALKEEGFRHAFTNGEAFTSSNADQLVQQFFEETLGQTTPTFRMDSLLAEMRDLERGLGSGPPVQSAPIAQLAAEHDVSCWAEQYLDAGKNFQETKQESIWSVPQTDDPSSNDTFELGFGPNWAKEYLESTSEQLHLDEPEVNLTDLGASEEYCTDNSKDDSELKATANEIISKTADDPKFNYSKFMKFMHQIGDGDVTFKDSDILQGVTDDFAGSWGQDFDNYKYDMLDEKWKEKSDLKESSGGDSGSKFMSMIGNPSSVTNDDDEDYNLHPWTQEYTDYIDFTSTFNNYKFAEENPMNGIPDILEEGQKRLKAGDIPGAVLCFEAAVKNNPENYLAWQLLGVTQAENEQDPQAIAAFKKCLELDPKNLTALMGLAVSYTNENYDHHACRALTDWLQANPKYSDLMDSSQSSLNVGGLSMLSTMDIHKEVCEKFITAARRHPLDIDPDVQCGLGVLFNLTNELDKAVDCFKSALQVRPNDFAIWNRLGATLANGGKPEEAVDAYHNALQLYPGFIRARYNLGITCTHLGAHRAAVEHFLSALNQQAAGRGMQGERSLAMSDTIWTTLRLVVTFLDKPELVQAVNDRDLERLNREFIGTEDLQS